MMHIRLEMLDKTHEVVCYYEYTMAGSNTERVIDYSVKTCRRRWVGVAWFSYMNVWNVHANKLLAQITIGEPTIKVERTTDGK